MEPCTYKTRINSQRDDSDEASISYKKQLPRRCMCFKVDKDSGNTNSNTDDYEDDGDFEMTNEIVISTGLIKLNVKMKNYHHFPYILWKSGSTRYNNTQNSYN